ncbi:hypothetical protein FPQ18DRAFT_399826 [Pyronema domesticum]|uniref:Uncharacterized protein n=1 Tax=Pyronema omphalodes (strain CBS 100304) TaxID=1076935 RepID=U4LTJ6_PYROM|nr:hypothetical protein FPQ18DRAFT_399826 [Pyronema domesticum]CCX32885.1 Similar to hypothetical protein [Tuber melanosporum Mel28]; acc. no. XP_002838322 [Pyronema omphalodes CBS 100304]
MVLHNDKWHRKAKRTYIRKGGEIEPKKGTVDPTKPAIPTAAADPKPGEAPGAPIKDGEAGSEEEQEEEEEEEDGDYRRRKVGSNAWRYEEEEPEFPLEANPDEPQEPEIDYVALTLERTKGQLKDEAEVSTSIDHEFLAESWGAPKKKPTVQKVKIDEGILNIREKIEIRNNAEAFKARFGSKAKARAPKGIQKEKEEGVDDIDDFLEELSLIEKEKKPVVQKETQVPKPKTISTTKDEDDEWLDSMLGGR